MQIRNYQSLKKLIVNAGLSLKQTLCDSGKRTKDEKNLALMRHVLHRDLSSNSLTSLPEMLFANLLNLQGL